jgi:hypothetical protein
VYAWFATGLAPFSDAAYVALGVPIATALVLYGALGGFSSREDLSSYYRERGAHTGLLPWVVVFVVALGLEIAGLALGGRSPNVPTLSATIDHLLVTHWGRWLLYLWWLWVGARAIAPLADRPQRREPS